MLTSPAQPKSQSLSSNLIFNTGRELAEEYGVAFLEIDFKKKEEFKRSVELPKQMRIYRQKYGGCPSSMD